MDIMTKPTESVDELQRLTALDRGRRRLLDRDRRRQLDRDDGDSRTENGSCCSLSRCVFVCVCMYVCLTWLY